MASSTAEAAQFSAAVNALYSSSSAEERSAANQWLVAFAATPNAWAAAYALMAEEREEMAFFGANMLNVKIRSEWHSMAEAARLAEYDRMWRACTEGGVGDGRSGPPGQATKRLCLALAAAAARTAGLAGQTARLALSMAAEGGARAGVALELLGALPQEVREEEESVRALIPAVSSQAPSLFIVHIAAEERR